MLRWYNVSTTATTGPTPAQTPARGRPIGPDSCCPGTRSRHDARTRDDTHFAHSERADTGSAYTGNAYSGVPAAPTPTTSSPTPENSGVVTVWVPYDAKVTINGLATT